MWTKRRAPAGDAVRSTARRQPGDREGVEVDAAEVGADPADAAEAVGLGDVGEEGGVDDVEPAPIFPGVARRNGRRRRGRARGRPWRPAGCRAPRRIERGVEQRHLQRLHQARGAEQPQVADGQGGEPREDDDRQEEGSEQVARAPRPSGRGRSGRREAQAEQLRTAPPAAPARASPTPVSPSGRSLCSIRNSTPSGVRRRRYCAADPVRDLARPNAGRRGWRRRGTAAATRGAPGPTTARIR